MPDTFLYDVFLSHSSKDKAIVRPLAERLRADGVKVWIDDWQIKPGDSIPAKIEEGLENSRVLLLCMSANAFDSDWARLESSTFRFRDPLNKERRFIPLRLDDAPLKGSLAQFLYINWRQSNREEEYAKLVEACHLSSASRIEEEPQLTEGSIAFDLVFDSQRTAVQFSEDGKRLISHVDPYTIGLWDMQTGSWLGKFRMPQLSIFALSFSGDARFALVGGMERWTDPSTVELVDFTAGAVRVFEGQEGTIQSLAWSGDQTIAASGSGHGTVFLWNVQDGRCIRELIGHSNSVLALAFMSDKQLLSGSADATLRLWDIESGNCLRILEGHTDYVEVIALRAGQRLALSGSKDSTIRLWDTDVGRCLRVLEGHSESVLSVAWNANQRFALTGSYDGTMRLWDLEAGDCLVVMKGRGLPIQSVSWSEDSRKAFSFDAFGEIRSWDLSAFVRPSHFFEPLSHHTVPTPDQVQYTNAKVLLVGDSGASKTGLSKRLALNDWQPSDSTVGAWATQWKLPGASSGGVEREIWLWDFGGQADQRLVHQLYMDETALAVLVFDGQKEDLFETLGQWDCDLSRASRTEFAKLLVAGRVDAGGLRVSRREVEEFAAERKFQGFLETSAKKNLGCDELRQAIVDVINWDELPCRTTKVLFKRLKEEIIALKDEGRALMRFNELRERLRLSGELPRFDDAELRSVLTLLTGPGMVWELAFGSWVLLKPEYINVYGQAVIRTLQADKHQRGCLMEERVLKGDLMYESPLERLQSDEERFVLLAMHHTLLERGVCLRQPTDKGNLLVFPRSSFKT